MDSSGSQVGELRDNVQSLRDGRFESQIGPDTDSGHDL